MEPGDLERLIDRELRALPPPHAPRALLPRVMAAVEDRAQRPWYTRAWLQWPVGWQLASALMLIGVVATGGVLLPQLRDAVMALSFVANMRGDVAESAREVEVATTAVRVVWRTLLAPVVPWAFALITLMCAACAVFGTALNHLVFGRAFR
ncbi:MAG TPA: hypothetical protein VM819_20555 [Vicinamibacterales bacterium]|jgi:hypothetical protein|nr:hypothetical protein [Vicinamibacterales bacterium]